MAGGLPYVEVPNPDTLPAQPYGVLLFVGLALGVLTAVWLGRRRGLSGTALGVLLPCALAAALVGGHGFDVAWYFPDADAARWLRFFDGQSLVGALLAAAVTAAIIAAALRLDGAQVADALTMGALVALTVGRVGCALVHDHLGVATDSVVGVDLPPRVQYLYNGSTADGDVLRVHDLGLAELLVLLVLVPIAFVLERRWRARPGLVAVVVALAYAVVRFGLDFLRLPSSEPTRGGLTGGQWGMVVLFAAAVFGLARLRRRTRPAG